MNHDQVNALFDTTILMLAPTRGDRFREYQIFVEVLGNTAERREHFLRFLHDVSTCPPEVIAWCQRELHALVQKRWE